jgi:hypothetical protein
MRKSPVSAGPECVKTVRSALSFEQHVELNNKNIKNKLSAIKLDYKTYYPRYTELWA